MPRGHFYLCGSAPCAQRALLPVRLNFALLVWLTPSRQTKKMRSAVPCTVLRVPRGHFYLFASTSLCSFGSRTLPSNKKMRSAACKGCASRAQRALLLVRLNFALLVWLTPSRQTKKCEVRYSVPCFAPKVFEGVPGEAFFRKFHRQKKTLPPHALRISPFRRRSGDRSVRGLCPVPGRHRE